MVSGPPQSLFEMIRNIISSIAPLFCAMEKALFNGLILNVYYDIYFSIPFRSLFEMIRYIISSIAPLVVCAMGNSHGKKLGLDQTL